jgi:hypothetical protein
MLTDSSKITGGRANSDDGGGKYKRADSDPQHEAQRKPFKHEPLDLNNASIRLVKILPLSSDGTVRCTVTHEYITTDVQYTCLSYVWGSKEDLEGIILNDRPFKVRQNLYQFLLVISTLKAGLTNASTTQEPRLVDLDNMTQYLWIDALCINQEVYHCINQEVDHCINQEVDHCINQEAVHEKNHQVRQMGRIYSLALQVISWLGNDPDIVSFFKFAQEVSSMRPSTFSLPLTLTDHTVGIIGVAGHSYWTRAWVTQEVILAQRLHLLANTETISLELLQNVGLRAIWHQKAFDRLGGPRIHGDSWKPIYALRRNRRDSTLLENLWHFRNKQCADERDRVYSLLSISGRDWTIADPRVRVDYARSRFELARDILLAHKAGICLCSIAITLQALKLNAEVDSNAETTRAWLKLSRWHHQRQVYYNLNVYYCDYCNASVEIDSKGPLHSERHFYLHCLGCRHYGSVRSPAHYPHRFGHLLLETKGLITTMSSQWKLSYIAPAVGNRTTYCDFRTDSCLGVDIITGELSLTLSIGEVAELLRMTPVEEILKDDNIKRTCEVFDGQEERQLALAECHTQD